MSNYFGVDPFNFTDENEFWAEVSEAMSASFGPEYSEMGYDDLSHENDKYEEESDEPALEDFETEEETQDRRYLDLYGNEYTVNNNDDIPF